MRLSPLYGALDEGIKNGISVILGSRRGHKKNGSLEVESRL